MNKSLSGIDIGNSKDNALRNRTPLVEGRSSLSDNVLIRAQNRADLRNIGWILLGFVCLLIVVTPTRSFPMTDDWLYAQSVGDLIRGAYAPHDYAQATALGHVAWGALFVAIFGWSFTILTLANMAMSVMGVILFYLLLRNLCVTPTYALLGAALLGCNPIYVYLSYSFMTDVTFLVYFLGACLCYIRGMQSNSIRWLWLGSIASALLYLTRQYGLLIVFACLVYLYLSRNWTWSRAAAVAAIPIAVTITYILWEQTQPTPLIAFIVADMRAFAMQHPIQFWTVRLRNIAWALPVIGLYLTPLLRLPRRRYLALLMFGLFAVFQIISLRSYGTLLPVDGNIVDHTGFIMFGYRGAPLWGEWVWTILGVTGALVFSLYVGVGMEQPWRQILAQLKQKRLQDPVLILYIVGMLLAGVVFVLTPLFFDRYLLPILVILMAPVLRKASTVQLNFRWRWLLVLPLALFSVVAMRDYMAHAAVRWQGAEQLVARGAQRDHIDAGFEWSGWYLYEEGARHVRATHNFINVPPFPPDSVLDPQFLVSDLPVAGYTKINSLSYQSWLYGGQARQVLVLQRNK